MATLYKILWVLALLLAVFVSGVLTAIWRGWGSPTVAVKVVNQSGQNIQSFSVAYVTCDTKGSIVGGELATGQTKTLHFSVCGEGGYTLAVVFADGRRITSTEGYVESGYLVTGLISQNGVTSSERTYGL